MSGTKVIHSLVGSKLSPVLQQFTRWAIELTIGPPLETDGDDFSAAVDLRDKARAFILEHCGEPSL